jgi:tetratricopeptide (TPR) repeat protein
VAAEQIPVDLDARVAKYRSLLATRRLLIVLDNARDAAQVRPLLPGGRGCAIVVTSRDHLAGLVAAEGATPVAVDPMTTADAAEVLLRRLGPDRIAAEPQAAAEILAWCAGLPLAIVIVAARAVMRDDRPLGALADELREAHRRLGALVTGDRGTDLREVFSWSYRALSPAAARLFRLLGLHPGSDISAAAAASLTGRSLASTRTALSELVHVCLAAEPTTGRYALHDLLRAYAADLVEQAESRPGRRAATRRWLAYYLHSGYAADRQLNPARDPITLPARPPGVAPEQPGDYPAALAWFTAERPVLLAAVDRAVAGGNDAEACGLAWALSGFLDRRGHWHDLLTTQDAAAYAARRTGDPVAEAGAHRMFARACTRLGRFPEAHDRLQRALRAYREAGDRAGQADTHLNLALVWQRQGEYACALDHAGQALELFPADDAWGQARAQNAAGWYHALLNDHRRAIDYCRPALRQFERLGDRNLQASALDSLGYAYHHLGDLGQAATCYRRAIDLLAELGDRHLEALVLTNLGDTLRESGDVPGARTTWRRALEVLADIDRPVADDVRTRLAALGPAAISDPPAAAVSGPAPAPVSGPPAAAVGGPAAPTAPGEVRRTRATARTR